LNNLGNNLGFERAKNILKAFGLTENESQIYFFLARTGTRKAGEISKLLKMYKGQVYRDLKSLQSKGMVEVTINAPAYFTAVSFSRILDSNIRTMRQETNSLESEGRELSKWIKIFSPIVDPPTEKLMVIEGQRNISQKIFQMIKEAEQEILIMICGLHWNQILPTDATRFMFDKINKGLVKLRILTQDSGENSNAYQKLFERAFKENLGNSMHWRSLNTKFDLQTRFFVKDKKEALFFLKAADNTSMANTEEVCLWTNCDALIHLMNALFNQFWNISIKIA
jgi:HTH-type transcriptional regulator, sugar sensing transcriptional regulator